MIYFGLKWNEWCCWMVVCSISCVLVFSKCQLFDRFSGIFRIHRKFGTATTSDHPYLYIYIIMSKKQIFSFVARVSLSFISLALLFSDHMMLLCEWVEATSCRTDYEYKKILCVTIYLPCHLCCSLSFCGRGRWIGGRLWSLHFICVLITCWRFTIGENLHRIIKQLLDFAIELCVLW